MTENAGRRPSNRLLKFPVLQGQSRIPGAKGHPLHAIRTMASSALKVMDAHLAALIANRGSLFARLLNTNRLVTSPSSFFANRGSLFARLLNCQFVLTFVFYNLVRVRNPGSGVVWVKERQGMGDRR